MVRYGVKLWVEIEDSKGDFRMPKLLDVAAKIETSVKEALGNSFEHYHTHIERMTTLPNREQEDAS